MADTAPVARTHAMVQVTAAPTQCDGALPSKVPLDVMRQSRLIQ
jgi:hypothetical protein